MTKKLLDTDECNKLVGQLIEILSLCNGQWNPAHVVSFEGGASKAHHVQYCDEDSHRVVVLDEHTFRVAASGGGGGSSTAEPLTNMPRAPSGGWRPFQSALLYARSLELDTLHQWRDWARTRARPADIPGNPDTVYGSEGWQGWDSWLATGGLGVPVSDYTLVQTSVVGAHGRVQGQVQGQGTGPHETDVAAGPHEFLAFDQALKIARSLKLRNMTEWIVWCASGARSYNMPSAPFNTYKHDGWRGWSHWLGTHLPSEPSARKADPGSTTQAGATHSGPDRGSRVKVLRGGEWHTGTVVVVEPTHVVVSYDLVFNDVAHYGAGRGSLLQDSLVRMAVDAVCPTTKMVRSDGYILGFTAGQTKLQVLLPVSGRAEWLEGTVVKLSGNITSIALESEGKVVDTRHLDVVGDRICYRVVGAPREQLRTGAGGAGMWPEANDRGELTAREFGRRQTADKLKGRTVQAPARVVHAHAHGDFHRCLHKNGVVVVRGAVSVAESVPKIMTAMDKTPLFNHLQNQDTDVPDDKKRRTRVLGMVPTSDMPEEFASLQQDVVSYMESTSVTWHGGRFVSMWSILESMEGCQQQRHHTDFAPEDLAGRDPTEIPLSMLVAVQDGTKLCIWDDEYAQATFHHPL